MMQSSKDRLSQVSSAYVLARTYHSRLIRLSCFRYWSSILIFFNGGMSRLDGQMCIEHRIDTGDQKQYSIPSVATRAIVEQKSKRKFVAVAIPGLAD